MVSRQLVIQILRRCVQFGLIALLIVMPVLCKKEIYFLQGSLFSLNLVGVPFADPVGMVQALPHDGEILLGAGMSLLVAFLMGRAFCGWACPYGLFSEFLHSIRRRIGGPEAPASAHHLMAERVARLIVLLACLVCTLALGYPLASLIAMPGNLSILPVLVRIQAGMAGVALALIPPVVGLAVELVVGRRVWCRYLCPQAIVLGASAWLASRLPLGLRIGWNPRKCTCRGGVRHCQSACSLCLTPRTHTGPSRLDCTMCGDCVRACHKKGGGALHWHWGVQKAEHVHHASVKEAAAVRSETTPVPASADAAAVQDKA